MSLRVRGYRRRIAVRIGAVRFRERQTDLAVHCLQARARLVFLKHDRERVRTPYP